MTWSTREVAELADTSLRTVRHYHEIGLLPEPERHSNGYKQYGVTHLIRLLRIRRLVDLGFGLPQIAELGDGDEHPEAALRALDAHLEQQIERLQRVRAEVAEMLDRRLATDLPVEFAGVGPALSESDRRLTSVIGRLLSGHERATYAELLSDEERTPSDQDFDDLPPDADEVTQQDLAARMAADLRAAVERRPGIATLGASDPRRFRRTVEQVSREVYNPAQLGVLARVGALHRQVRPGRPAN